MAKAKAEDDINVRYAIASAAVAKAEYEVNQKASEKHVGSVLTQRLSELMLKCKEYDLAVEKARLDLRIAERRGQDRQGRGIGQDTKFPDDRKAQHELEAAEAEARYSVAKARAEDDINFRYAVAAAEVAKAEYEVNKKSQRHRSRFGCQGAAQRTVAHSARKTDLVSQAPGTTSELPVKKPTSPRPSWKRPKGRPLISDKQEVVTNPNFTGGSSCC